MKDISVARAKDGTFEITIDGASHTLSAEEIKVLLLRVLEAFTGAGKRDRKALVKKLMAANDPGVQSVLRTADHEDVLILLKIHENDERLHEKLFGNMSPTMQKIFREDLLYKFQEPPPGGRVGAAVARLRAIAARLEKDGLLEYGA